MPSLDQVNCAATEFTTNPAAFTLFDLAYGEYVARDRFGFHNAHVESYFFYLAHTYPSRSDFRA